MLSVFSLVSSLRLTQASSLYSGDQLLRLRLTSRDQCDLVTSLRGHDLWSAVSLIRPVDIHCTRDHCPDLKSILRDHDIQFSVEVEDLAEASLRRWVTSAPEACPGGQEGWTM